MSDILEALERHRNKEKISFHMPGHKSKRIEAYEALKKHLLSYDVTELSDTDDLYNAHLFLDTFHKKLASFAHAKESFALTNGTTVGILSAIFATTDFGDTILFERNTHKSVYHACELRQLKKIILENPSKTVPLGEEEYIFALKKTPSIRLVVITRPNYFGYVMTIEKLVTYCQKHQIILLVDEAHGSHFALPFFPKNAMQEGADIAVNSFHKTFPALTQTSAIHFQAEEWFQKTRSMIEYFQSSSPSYLLMASLEISMNYILENQHQYKRLFREIELLKKNIDQLEYFSIPKDNDPFYRDPTRLCIQCESPHEVQHYLEKQGIFIEMISEHYLVLILTILDTRKDFDTLYHSLKKYRPQHTFFAEETDWKKYIGKIAAENVMIYPPGSVIIEKGTKITKEHISDIIKNRKKGINIYTDFSKQSGEIIVKGERYDCKN